MSATIRNPILPGFNPDPSICRVGEDYYIATSTFEWYPGVQIHHSRDLVTWRLVGRPLDRASLLDLRGEPDSCGVWAPCLSHADGKFWLVYTDVKRLDGNFKDAHNYIVTAPAIEGPWSERAYVNSSGFDPSLFHDDDGLKWFVNMLWNHRDPAGARLRHPAFFGIALQEWDAQAGRLIGEAKTIFTGSPHGLVEGPHLHKRKGWYYLTTAEGGTGYDHAVTMARSRRLDGPYELHPNVHLITSKDAPAAPLQRAGHGQIVETPDGQVYHTHLCSRPLPGQSRSPLGRETAIQKCVWGDDDWLYLADGGQVPSVAVPPPFATPAAPARARERSVLSPDRLPPDFQWLRTPHPERIFSLAARPGWLRLIGRESIGSWFEQALVARRQEHFVYRAEVELDFEPRTFQQAAGLTAYYNRYKFHALAVGWSETAGRSLTILSCAGDYPEGRLTFPLPASVAVGEGPIRLAVSVDHARLQFAYALSDGVWRDIGPALDASLLSDEAGGGEHRSFTGAFVGMFAFDTSGGAAHADFRDFDYEGADDD
ncbi:glycoside hydrolase family 43 protein [Roseiarcus fermentans]|uniref:glycoside hydrolase family 43 protein n=1 Tax=Roseiarcus fermentans TaxID=1473586 RepID=UPI000DE870CD|nr:glycoside hydrolase family 43 protein [Roseiarcus fermentans]